MILKSVELFGFKSFPERTRLEFRDGISAILGPNGCGKSNIVDAIRWVVGEQSTKSLRAVRMDDVIFNGSEDRRPLNVAEVTLTLGNDDGQLPLDMPEVSIRRRLFRSGESEYSINRRTVRLKEIRELFFDTGIGKSAYSVIEQGKIDQILSSKPEDKRYIFDEAAGITRFKVEAQDAERKLERTEQNMRQANAIFSEVKRRYNSLKVQAEKTERYRSLSDGIFELERDIQLLNLKDFLAKRDQREAKLLKSNDRRGVVQKKIDAINQSMEACIEKINRMESQFIEGQKKSYGLDLEKNAHDSQIRILRERVGELGKKIQDDELRQQNAGRKLSTLQNDLGKNEGSLGRLEQELVKVRENIRGFEKDIGIFSAKIAANEKAVSYNLDEIAAREKDSDDLQIKLRRITDDIVTQLDQRLKEMGSSYRDRRQVEGEISEIIGFLTVQIEGRRVLLDDVAALGRYDEKKIGGVIETTKSVLGEGLARLSRLKELFGIYRKAMPSFIDEFLSPEGIITQKRAIDTELAALHAGITGKREENDRYHKENRDLSGRIEEYRKTLENLRVNAARMETKRTNLTAEKTRLEREVHEQEQALRRYEREVEETRERIAVTEARIEKQEAERKALDRQEQSLRQALSKMEGDIAGQNAGLLEKEKTLKKHMDQLLKIQSEVEETHVQAAEIKTEIKNIYENFAEKNGRDLSEYESRIFEIKVPARELRRRLGTLRDDSRKLGHVNLMAPEEFLEAKQRFEFFSNQLEDLTKAKHDLKRVTDEIHTESVDLFLNAFSQIKKNFHVMFRRLFGGGRAELRLMQPDNVLESGIDILAQPPGKKLENIALLSGGESALTGVALLFAVYLTKPSPFCVLDEIDAALDDQNIQRFVDMLQEFAADTQFLVISHNKRTIVGARSLVGITMEESGVSKIVATSLRGAQN